MTERSNPYEELRRHLEECRDRVSAGRALFPSGPWTALMNNPLYWEFQITLMEIFRAHYEMRDEMRRPGG